MGGGDVSRKDKWFALVELAAVFLITAAAFAWGKQLSLMERGYAAYGGEYLLLLLPILYYTAKTMR